jgi:hypothetical protein
MGTPGFYRRRAVIRSAAVKLLGEVDIWDPAIELTKRQYSGQDARTVVSSNSISGDM